MNCDQIRELLEAYALDALEADERTAVEQHLAACPECQHLVEEFVDAAHSLPQALATVAAAKPPAAMKQRLLQALAADPAQPQVEPEADSAERAVSQATPAPSSNGKPKDFQWQRPPLWVGLSRESVSAVAVLGIVLLLVVTVSLGARLSTVLAQERALRAELAVLFGQQEVVLEVIDSDKTVRRVLLAPERTDTDSPPYGKLFSRTDLPHVVAMIARLPQPPAGQAYHLWLTQDGQPRLAGIMEVNDDGFSLLAFDADRDGPEYAAAELRLQPEGSSEPGGEVVLQWVAEE